MAVFTNQAQLSYNDSIKNSNIAVGEILEVLSATKTAVREEYGQNDSVTYVVSLVNSGGTALNGLTLTDNLGEYPFGAGTLVPLTYIPGTIRYYINGTLQMAPAVAAGPPLVISGINLPAGGNGILVYEAEVNQYAPLDAEGSITNTAVVSGAGITPVTVEETVTTEDGPNLTITKSICPVPVTENGTLTYTFVIQNTGNTAAGATDNVAVTDLFDPILTNLSVSFNGATWTDGVQYNYDETTGLFATVPGQITVPAATFTQDPTMGVWVINPGVSTLVVAGTV